MAGAARGEIQVSLFVARAALGEFFWSNYSDLTRPHPKLRFSKGNPLISKKSRLVKYYTLTRFLTERRVVLGCLATGSYDFAICECNMLFDPQVLKRGVARSAEG